MHHPGMFAALLNRPGDQVFFANMRLVHIFNRHAMRIGQFVRALAYALTPEVSKCFGIVEYSDVAEIQETGRASCVRRTGQCACDKSYGHSKKARRAGLLDNVRSEVS